MKYRLLLAIILALSPIAQTKAGEPEIVQVSPGTYMIFAEDHRGIFGNSSSMRAKAIRQANEFAAKKGKVAIAVSTSFTPLGNGPAKWATFEYQFQLLDPSDARASGSTLKQVSDVTVSIEGSQPSPAPTTTSPKQEDLYSQLIKLDDLRKRGIINDQEFERQKGKILNNGE